MSKQLHRSVMLNWIGLALRICVALVLLPFIVESIGVGSYGEYVFLVAIFGYSGVLEIGLRASILRYTGNMLGRGDYGPLNRILGTIFSYYLLAAAIVVGGGAVLYFATPPWIVPDGASDKFPLYGGTAALVAASTFFRVGWSSVLRANERYDLLNLVDISGVLMRAGIIVLMLNNGFGLISVLVGDLFDNLYGAVASRLAVRVVAPQIRLEFGRLDPGRLREVLSYSGWAFLNSLAFQFRFRGPSILVGGVLSTGAAGFFGVATRLQSYVYQLGTSMNSPLRARATHVAGVEGPDGVRPILFQGTRYLTFLAGSIGVLLYAHAHEILIAWMGPEFHESASILRILLFGLTAEISALMLGGALYATGHLKSLTITNFAEAMVMIALAYVLARSHGVLGVAAAVSLALVVNKVVVQPLLLLGILGVPLWDWISRSLWRPVVAVTAGAGVIWAIRSFWRPDSLIEVGAQLLIGGFILLALGWGVVFAPSERATALRSIGVRPSAGTQ